MRCQEDGQKSGLDQQRVPLEIQERLAGLEQRQVEDECGYQCRALPDVEDNEHRGNAAGNRRAGQYQVAGIQPEQRGDQEVAFQAAVLRKVSQPFSDGQDALAAGQALDLQAEREEGNQVDAAKQTQEYSRDEAVAVSVACCHRLQAWSN